MDEHRAEIPVAAFADAVELCLAPGGVLSRHQSEPSGKLAPLTKRCAIANGRDEGFTKLIFLSGNGPNAPPLESARGLSPEEAARAIHGALEEASRDSVCMMLSSVSQYGPREGERPQPYLLRLSENITFEFLSAEFSSGSLTASSVRPTIYRLSAVIVEAIRPKCLNAPVFA